MSYLHVEQPEFGKFDSLAGPRSRLVYSEVLAEKIIAMDPALQFDPRAYNGLIRGPHGAALNRPIGAQQAGLQIMTSPSALPLASRSPVRVSASAWMLSRWPSNVSQGCFEPD